MPRRDSDFDGKVYDGVVSAVIDRLCQSIERAEGADQGTEHGLLIALHAETDRRRLADLCDGKPIQLTHDEMPADYRPDHWHPLYELRPGDELVPVETQRRGQPRRREWTVA